MKQPFNTIQPGYLTVNAVMNHIYILSSFITLSDHHVQGWDVFLSQFNIKSVRLFLDKIKMEPDTYIQIKIYTTDIPVNRETLKDTSFLVLFPCNLIINMDSP